MTFAIILTFQIFHVFEFQPSKSFFVSVPGGGHSRRSHFGQLWSPEHRPQRILDPVWRGRVQRHLLRKHGNQEAQVDQQGMINQILLIYFAGNTGLKWNFLVQSTKPFYLSGCWMYNDSHTIIECRVKLLIRIHPTGEIFLFDFKKAILKDNTIQNIRYYTRYLYSIIQYKTTHYVMIHTSRSELLRYFKCGLFWRLRLKLWFVMKINNLLKQDNCHFGLSNHSDLLINFLSFLIWRTRRPISRITEIIGSGKPNCRTVKSRWCWIQTSSCSSIWNW